MSEQPVSEVPSRSENHEARRCIVCEHPGPFEQVFTTDWYGFTMVRCPSCGLVFQNPQLPEEAIEQSYYDDPEYAAQLIGPLREFTVKRAREKLGLLAGLGAIRPGARVLDVGCSSGAWLEVARAAGMTATGVEIGETTAQQARERGLDVRTGSLRQAFDQLRDDHFDLITFWDVLEHLRDPREELAIAARLLAPRGLLALTLPNVEGWYPRMTYRLLAKRTGRWEHPEPVHLYDFGPDTLTRLLKRQGYEVIKLRTLETPFEFYRQTTLTIPRLGFGRRARIMRVCFEALKLVVYPAARLFDRGNALFVAADISGTHA